MADVHLYDGDVGTTITVEVDAPNLSAATKEIHWKKPSGATVAVDVVTYDEAAKTISWTVPDAFWDEIGVWEGQAFLQYSTEQKYYGDLFKVDVRETLI